jgi:hypothetical protein
MELVVRVGTMEKEKKKTPNNSFEKLLLREEAVSLLFDTHMYCN